jgi:hypothetical protein
VSRIFALELEPGDRYRYRRRSPDPVVLEKVERVGAKTLELRNVDGSTWRVRRRSWVDRLAPLPVSGTPARTSPPASSPSSSSSRRRRQGATAREESLEARARALARRPGATFGDVARELGVSPSEVVALVHGRG